jgi:hypothetical protein
VRSQQGDGLGDSERAGIILLRYHPTKGAIGAMLFVLGTDGVGCDQKHLFVGKAAETPPVVTIQRLGILIFARILGKPRIGSMG